MHASHANASKSKQATSRKKTLEKIELDDIRPSSRKYPFVNFQIGREIGNDVLTVDGLSATQDGKRHLKDIRFTMNKEDKIILLGSPLAKTALLEILAGRSRHQMLVSFKWGVTTSRATSLDNSKYFTGSENNHCRMVTPIFTRRSNRNFLRGFLVVCYSPVKK